MKIKNLESDRKQRIETLGIIVREDAIEGVIMKFLQIHFREK